MKTRTILTAVIALTIIIGSSSAALAWNGNCWNQNAQMQTQNLTPEQQTAIQKFMNDSGKRLEPLMEQMQAKSMELNALSGNTNAKPADIAKLSAEIAALQTQIRNEMSTRNDSIVAQGGGAGMGGVYGGMGMNGRHGGRRGHGGHGGYNYPCMY